VGQGVVIFDAPLIYEWGSEGRFDRMVVVDAAEDLRIQRVGERSGLSEGEIRERMNLQMDPDEKRARADYVIDNNGDMTALERQADNLWTVLIAEAGKGGGDG
jgi:dephospho-CoA kinase